MKGLSSLERIILESIGRSHLAYEDLQAQTGLHENVFYNVLQALIIRGLVNTDGNLYRISNNLSPIIVEELNGKCAIRAESLELIEAIIEENPGYKVKQITVRPGGKLSLQYHHHRSEHWIVVSGLATITVNDQVFELGPNESTYIPKEAKHRLANNHTENLILIEAQVGQYLGEDDIVRLQDDYKRN